MHGRLYLEGRQDCAFAAEVGLGDRKVLDIWSW